MKMERSTLWVLQTLLVLLSPVGSAPCPRPCSCPQPAELHCTFRSLLTVPAAVPKHVKRINLGSVDVSSAGLFNCPHRLCCFRFNSIHEISDTSLSGLGKLELLMVHGNNIHSLPDGEINRHTLQGLWSVARLHLDHNQIELIHPDAFQGLTSLLVITNV
uniref:LRRNT domain-containing protein n=1 Tax=Poecilia mexicana TaxID=48701 RepID=A0A3B3WET5_9TELE